MSKPNIFDYATSELSQDAFLCWLLSWADHKYASKDEHLHEVGAEFVRDVMKKFGKSVYGNIDIKGIWQQWSGIDVMTEIYQGDKKYVLVIEDKTETSMHGNQLQRYKEAAEKEYPDWTVLPLYLKTGAISRGQEAEDEGYKVYSGRNLLDVLEIKATQIDNDIFNDFYKFLKCKVDRIEAFRTKNVDEWVKGKDAGEAWQGFFSALKEEMKSHDECVGWQYDANASGGELIAHWGWNWDIKYHGKYSVYLQIIKKATDDRFFLAFKVTDVPKEERYDVRWDLCHRVREESKSKGWDFVDKPKKFGNGNSMVFCQTCNCDVCGCVKSCNDCWLAKNASGILDMEKTIENLKDAKRILYDAVTSS